MAQQTIVPPGYDDCIEQYKKFYEKYEGIIKGIREELKKNSDYKDLLNTENPSLMSTIDHDGFIKLIKDIRACIESIMKEDLTEADRELYQTAYDQFTEMTSQDMDNLYDILTNKNDDNFNDYIDKYIDQINFDNPINIDDYIIPQPETNTSTYPYWTFDKTDENITHCCPVDISLPEAPDTTDTLLTTVGSELQLPELYAY